MSVYVDDAFCGGDDWGKWQGGGHMQADTLEELHAMASQLGLKRAWFQSRTNRPWNDHYDLTANKRETAVHYGAIQETLEDAAERRKAARA